jgi:hypothetical protein
MTSIPRSVQCGFRSTGTPRSNAPKGWDRVCAHRYRKSRLDLGLVHLLHDVFDSSLFVIHSKSGCSVRFCLGIGRHFKVSNSTPEVSCDSSLNSSSSSSAQAVWPENLVQTANLLVDFALDMRLKSNRSLAIPNISFQPAVHQEHGSSLCTVNAILPLAQPNPSSRPA